MSSNSLFGDLAARVPFLEHVERGVRSAHSPLPPQPFPHEEQASNQDGPEQDHDQDSDTHHGHLAAIGKTVHVTVPPRLNGQRSLSRHIVCP